MDDYLFTIDSEHLNPLQDETKNKALVSLERGQVVYLPNDGFTVNANEYPLLSESILNPKHKNMSYDYLNERLAGLNKTNEAESMTALTHAFMHRFACYSKELIDTLFPHYTQHLRWGRTSYRPAEIKGRPSSKLKDDTRVHVDSFTSTPVNGLRILRVFSNINPYGDPRVWHLGESFPQVMNRFSEKIASFNSTQAKLLKLIKATKTLRSPYDHYMLNLHNKMKLDDRYQQTLSKERMEFPANSTWVVFTDQVSHAALSGQFLLEQTFYLPVDAMMNPALSPLKQWEAKKGLELVLAIE